MARLSAGFPVLALPADAALRVAVRSVRVWLLLHKTSFGRVVAPAIQRPEWGRHWEFGCKP